jgi:hypothetical protein
MTKQVFRTIIAGMLAGMLLYFIPFLIPLLLTILVVKTIFRLLGFPAYQKRKLQYRFAFASKPEDLSEAEQLQWKQELQIRCGKYSGKNI